MTTDLFRPWPFGELRSAHYGLILADPPWAFKLRSEVAAGIMKSPQRHYDCMDLADIMELPVRDLALENAICVMWATAPMLPQALATLAAWGFAYNSIGAWAKQSSTGLKWNMGTGYRLRSAAEFWLVGTRGTPPTKARNIRNLIIAPVREHSRKPDEMRKICRDMSDGPYVELFARERAPGWDSFGLEVEKFDKQETPA